MSRKELTDFEHGAIYGLWKGEKHSIREIASVLNIPKSTVLDHIKKFKEGAMTFTSRSGRPSKLNEYDKRVLVRDVIKNRRMTIKETTQIFNTSRSVKVSFRTVQRTLHSLGYYGRTAKKKPFVSLINKKKRFYWSYARRFWKNEWDFIIFSDESRFELFKNDSNNWVWRKADEKYKKECLRPTVKKSDGIMVWGCFCRDTIGPLVLIEDNVTALKYVDILEENLLPFLNELGKDIYSFQDDNAPVHRAQKVKRWIEKNSINVIPWPPQSPDLNPIENIWAELERKIRSKKVRPRNKREFFGVLENEWYNLNLDYLNRLIDSMPYRVNEVVKNKGYPTRY